MERRVNIVRVRARATETVRGRGRTGFENKDSRKKANHALPRRTIHSPPRPPPARSGTSIPPLCRLPAIYSSKSQSMSIYTHTHMRH